MPVTNVKSKWSSGKLQFTDTSGNLLFELDGTNLKTRIVPKIVAKTADYTVVAADDGTTFTTTGAAGAVNFTLPAVTNTGFTATFINTVDQHLTVTAPAANTMVTVNNATATSVSVQTAAHQIGQAFRVVSDGAKWLVELLVDPAATVTVA